MVRVKIESALKPSGEKPRFYTGWRRRWWAWEIRDLGVTTQLHVRLMWWARERTTVTGEAAARQTTSSTTESSWAVAWMTTTWRLEAAALHVTLAKIFIVDEVNINSHPFHSAPYFIIEPSFNSPPYFF